MMPDREARFLKEHFNREADQVFVPPPPEMDEVRRYPMRRWLPRLAFAAAMCAAVAAFAITAGRETRLSHAVNTVMLKYEVSETIAGFFEHAGNWYSNEPIRGGER
jgi:hypothetical protein